MNAHTHTERVSALPLASYTNVVEKLAWAGNSHVLESSRLEETHMFGRMRCDDKL